MCLRSNKSQARILQPAALLLVPPHVHPRAVAPLNELLTRLELVYVLSLHCFTFAVTRTTAAVVVLTERPSMNIETQQCGLRACRRAAADSKRSDPTSSFRRSEASWLVLFPAEHILLSIPGPLAYCPLLWMGLSRIIIAGIGNQTHPWTRHR